MSCENSRELDPGGRLEICHIPGAVGSRLSRHLQPDLQSTAVPASPFPPPPNTPRPTRCASSCIADYSASVLAWDCVADGRESAPVSCELRMEYGPPFFTLQVTQAQTTFSHVVSPPRLRRNHMIDAQQMGWETPTAVLAFMAVVRQHVATAQMHFLLRQTIERQQANHAGHLDFEVDRFDPIVSGLFRIRHAIRSFRATN